MINAIQERKNEIRSIINDLDITPSMFKNAEEKYNNISRYLKDNGLNVSISLQGSFAIGTATKPYSRGEDKSYDVDAICLFDGIRLVPDELRNKLYSVLNSSEVYKDKLEEWPKCITLKYAEFDDYEFSIDLVPTALDNDSNFEEKVDLKYCVDIMKIAVKGEIYSWYPINPKGYQLWFNDINNRFALYGRSERMNKIFECNRQLYSKIEEIPEVLNKSALQEAIQLLKRSRDVYYSKIKKDDIKPASIIITTIAAIVAKKEPDDVDSIDLALIILDEIIKCDKDKLYSISGNKPFWNNDHWSFINPVNPCDNLLDSWNLSVDNSRLFFNWVYKVYKDLKDILDEHNDNYIEILGNLLGNNVVNKHYNRPDITSTNIGAKPYHE